MSVTDLDSVPKLRASPDGRGHWRIYCQHCHRAHTHGGLGRRFAHCLHRVQSPYKQTGYILVPRCNVHPDELVDTVADSNGWLAFTCSEGCWLGVVDL